MIIKSYQIQISRIAEVKSGLVILMKKIELEIVALSHSITQTHSYAVVLGEVNGLRRLPIVIGGFEAQAIAVALEKMHPSRPLTHDLMKNFMNAFNIDLQEIIICDLQEGIFYSKLLCVSEHDTVEIDSRTSDALALAVRFGCPIYTYDNILESAGILMEDSSGKKKIAREAVPHRNSQRQRRSQALSVLKSLTICSMKCLNRKIISGLSPSAMRSTAERNCDPPPISIHPVW